MMLLSLNEPLFGCGAPGAPLGVVSWSVRASCESAGSLPWGPKLDPSPGLPWGPTLPVCLPESSQPGPGCRVRPVLTWILLAGCVCTRVFTAIFTHYLAPLGELMACGSQDCLPPSCLLRPDPC